jgi:predicted O-methyltransferase YrrM
MLIKLWRIFSTLIKNPKSILRVLNPTEAEAQNLVAGKYNLPNGLGIVPFSRFLNNHEIHSVFPYTFLEGGSLPTDYLLLKQLASNPSCKTYFEIGTWRGESLMNVAPFVEKAYSLNLDTHELLNRGASGNYIEQVGMFAKDVTNVELLKGDSTRFNFEPWYGKCDLVFIDGDHNYTSIISDTQNALKLMRSQKSIIVWHDYGHSPEVIRWDVLLAILDTLPISLRKNLYHIANTKCAILFPENLEHDYITRPMQPDSIFEVNIKIKEQSFFSKKN